VLLLSLTYLIGKMVDATVGVIILSIFVKVEMASLTVEKIIGPIIGKMVGEVF